MRLRLIPIAVLSLVLVLPPPSGAQKASFSPTAVKQTLVRKSAETITAAQLEAYLTFVASDEMNGRNTPSTGLNLTAKFIETLLTRWGVKPAGDNGSYFQAITLKRQTLAPDGTSVSIGKTAFEHGRDFLAAALAGSVNGAEMVFAGDGWFFKGKNVDAYKDVDPKGKVVVILSGGLPKGVTMADLMSGKRGEDWMDPVAYAQKKGAVAVVTLNTLLNQVNPDAMANVKKQVENASLAPEKFAAPAAPLPTIMANYKLAQSIFSNEKVLASAILMPAAGGAPVAPFALSSEKKISITVKTTTETEQSQNVVAIVEGSDPKLKSEYVALGAHYDHVAGGQAVNGDAIYNGADDDGSGTVALLAIAEALAKAPRAPKRSTLFVWHMGEEKGLWGAKYFTMFPTVPLDRVVAQLNIDMIGRSRAENDSNPLNKKLTGPNELYVIGSKMMSTELGELSEAVNTAYEKLSFNYRYDDPNDPDKFFFRSDHIHYALKNIPIIFYFTGEHADYHRPSDEVSRIDFRKYERIARTIYVTLWEIGEMKTRLKVDKALPPEAKTLPF